MHTPLENMFDTLRLYSAIAQTLPLLLVLSVAAVLFLRRRAAKSETAQSMAGQIFGVPGL